MGWIKYGNVWFILIVFLFQNMVATAQNRMVTGQVKNDKGEPLASTSITLLRADSSIVLFTTTNREGKFTLKIDDQSLINALLSANSLGYEKSYQTLNKELLQGDSKVDFILTEKLLLLNTVNINVKIPIRERADTLIFDLASFTNKTERSLEDAITKLPGFRVDNGTISFNGKEIRKIKIDDDDLVGQDYRLISKNLSADLVSQVELLNDYMDNPLLKGIQYSSDIALNIRLKDDRKKLFFGDIEALGGKSQKQKTTLNAFVLSKGIKIFSTGSTNNTGAALDPPNLNSFSANLLGSVFNPTPQNSIQTTIYSPTVSGLSKERSFFNNARLGSFNLTSQSSKKLSVRLNFNDFEDKNFSESIFNTRYFTLNDTLFLNESNIFKSNPKTLLAKVNLNYRVTKNSTFVFDYGVSSSKQYDYAQNSLNKDAIDQQLRSKDLYQKTSFEYTNRFNSMTIVQIQTAYLAKTIQQDFHVVSDPMLLNSEIVNPYSFKQGYKNPYRSFNSQAKITTRTTTMTLGGSMIFEEQSTTIKSKIQTESADMKEAIGEPANNLTQYFTKLGIAGFLQKRMGKLNSTLTASLLYDEISQTDLLNKENNTESKRVSILPTLNFAYFLSNRVRIQLNYQFNQNPIPIENQYSSYIFSNYRNASRYISDESYRNTQSLSLGFRLEKPYQRFLMNGSLYYVKTGNRMLTDNTFDVLFNLSTGETYRNPINSKGFRFSVDKVLKNLDLVVMWSVHASENQYHNRVNHSTIRTINNRLALNSISINSIFSTPYNFIVRAKNSYSITEVSTNKLNRSVWNLSIQNSLKLTENLLLFQNLEHYSLIRKTTENFNISFLDFGAEWSILNDKLSFKTSLQNVLNKHKYLDYNIMDYYDSMKSYELQPRTMLIGAKYRF